MAVDLNELDIKQNVSYRKLNLSSEKINSISVNPKVSNGKMLFDKNNENHRYIVEDDN